MLYRSLVFCVLATLVAVVSLGQEVMAQKSDMNDAAAMATAQKLHDELNRLEVAGDLDSQSKYFDEAVVRMDAFRPVLKGKSQWLSLQRNLRTSRSTKFRVQSIKTQVMAAWQAGDRLYEYGSTDMTASIGGSIVSDPVDYFAVWRVNPGSNPQIEFIIWNPVKPVQQLNRLSTAAIR